MLVRRPACNSHQPEAQISRLLRKYLRFRTISLSRLIPIIHYSNEPHHTCKFPYTPMSLNYTLGASLSKSGIGSLLISAQRAIQVQLNFGHGSDRIRHTVLHGQFWRYHADLTLYANDLQCGGRALTWSELFSAIDLVRYCGFERRVYLEMFADIYMRYTMVGSVLVKLSRPPVPPPLDGDGLMAE